jgi:hypothetical protein
MNQYLDAAIKAALAQPAHWSARMSERDFPALTAVAPSKGEASKISTRHSIDCYRIFAIAERE